MDFQQCFTQFNEKYLDFIKNHTPADYIFLQDTKIFQNLKALIDNYNLEASNHIQQFQEQSNRFNQKTDKTYKEFKDHIAVLKENFLSKLESITKSKRFSIQKIKETIEEKKDITKNSVDTLKDEKELVITSTNNTIYSFLIERDHIIERLNGYAAHALKSYSNIISNFNQILERKTSSIHAANSKLIFRNEELTKEKIALLNKQIEEIENTLNQNKIQLDNQKEQIQDAILNQSIKINILINKLDKDFQQDIKKLKSSYNASLAEITNQIAALEEPKERESKTILNDFLDKLNLLEVRIDNSKANYQQKYDELTRKYEYEIVQLEKKIGRIDQKNKKNSAQINIKQLNLLKREKKIVMGELFYTYIREVEKLKEERFILEKNKNHKLFQLEKRYENLEKKYRIEQEIIEKNYQSEYKLLQINLNQAINKIKHHSDVRTTNLKKNLENLLLKNQKIELDIKNNLNSALSIRTHEITLNSLTNEKLSKISKMEIDYSQVLTQLIIENNKILTEFNSSIHNLNIENAKFDYVRKEKNAFYKRDYEVTMTDLVIKRHQLDLSHFLAMKALTINKEENDETRIRAEHKINYIKNIGLEKYHLYLKRFRYEMIQLYYLYELYEFLFNNFNIVINQTLSLLLTDITNFSKKSFRVFLADLLILFEEYQLQLSDAFSYAAIDLIKKRISFETGFKYDSLFQDLEEDFNTENMKLLRKEENLKETIKNYETTKQKYIKTKIEQENRLSILKTDYMKQNSFINDSTYSKKVKEFQMNIKDLDKKIDTNQDSIDTLRKSLSSIPKQRKKISNTYKKKYTSIYNRQRKESFVYYQTIDSIENSSSSIKNILQANYALLKITDESIFKEYCKNIYTFKKRIKTQQKTLSKHYQNLKKRTVIKVGKNHLSLKYKYLSNEKKDLVNLSRQTRLTNKELQSRIASNNNQFKLQIKSYNNELLLCKNQFKERKVKEEHQIKEKKILLDKTRMMISLDFHQDNSSMLDNIYYLKKNFHKDKKNVEDTFQKTIEKKNAEFKRNSKSRIDNLNESLKKNKLEMIYLPKKEKNDILLLENQFKNDAKRNVSLQKQLKNDAMKFKNLKLKEVALNESQLNEIIIQDNKNHKLENEKIYRITKEKISKAIKDYDY